MLDHFPDRNHNLLPHETVEEDLPPPQPLEKWVAVLIGATGVIILAKAYLA